MHPINPKGFAPILPESFIEDIQAIEADPEQLKNFEGMVKIPAGNFTMGAKGNQAKEDEQPLLPTTINRLLDGCHRSD